MNSSKEGERSEYRYHVNTTAEDRWRLSVSITRDAVTAGAPRRPQEVANYIAYRIERVEIPMGGGPVRKIENDSERREGSKYRLRLLTDGGRVLTIE